MNINPLNKINPNFDDFLDDFIQERLNNPPIIPQAIDHRVNPGFHTFEYEGLFIQFWRNINGEYNANHGRTRPNRFTYGGETYESIRFAYNKGTQTAFIPLYKTNYTQNPGHHPKNLNVDKTGILCTNEVLITALEKYFTLTYAGDIVGEKPPYFQTFSNDPRQDVFSDFDNNQIRFLIRDGPLNIFDFFEEIIEIVYRDRNYTDERFKLVLGYDLFSFIERNNFDVMSIYLTVKLDKNEYIAERIIRAPTLMEIPLYSTDVEYVPNANLKYIFDKKKDLYSFFYHSDIPLIKRDYGDDGCIPFVLSENDIDADDIIQPILTEDEFREGKLVGMTGRELYHSLRKTKRRFVMIDKDNDIIAKSDGTGREARKALVKLIISSEGHVFNISKRTCENSLGNEIYHPSENILFENSIKKLKFSKGLFLEGDISKIEDEIKTLVMAQKRSGKYIVEPEIFEKIFKKFTFDNRKHPIISKNKDGEITSMRFIFGNTEKGSPNSKNFTIQSSQFSKKVFEYKNELLSIFYNSETRSCYSEETYKFIKKGKDKSLILTGIYDKDKTSDVIGLDYNKAYYSCLCDILKMMSGCGIIKLNYQDKPSFFDRKLKLVNDKSEDFSLIENHYIYLVQFTFSDEKKYLTPIHDGLYTGLFLKKFLRLNQNFEIFESLVLISYLSSPFTIPRKNMREMIEAIDQYKKEYSLPDVDSAIKQLPNILIGIFEKINVRERTSSGDKKFAIVKEKSNDKNGNLDFHSFEGNDYFTTSYSNYKIPLRSGCFPMALAIKNCHVFNIVKQIYEFNKRSGIVPIGIRTDSIFYNKSEFLESRNKLQYNFSNEIGRLKIEEKNKVIYQKFSRNEIKVVNPLQFYNHIESSMIVELSSPDEIKTLKESLYQIPIVILIGNAGSGKTFFFEGDSHYQKEETMILTFEGAPSENWCKKGYKSLTYHTGFKLSLGDDEALRKISDFSNIKTLVFEEFGKMSKNQQFDIKKKFYQAKTRYPNITQLIVTMGITQIISPADRNCLVITENINRAESYISHSEKYITTLFDVRDTMIFRLNYNMREKNIEDSKIRNEIQSKIFKNPSLCEELIRKYFEVRELRDDVKKSIDVSDRSCINIFDTNKKIIECVFYNIGWDYYAKIPFIEKKNNEIVRNVRIGTHLKLIKWEDVGEQHFATFKIMSGKHTDESLRIELLDKYEGFDEEGEWYEEKYPCYNSHFMTGNVAQGTTIDGEVNILISSPFTLIDPFWIYQAITRSTENDNIVFYIRD